MKLKHEDEGRRPRSAIVPESNQEDAEPRPSATDFRPIKINGEPLSETIIRERRERPW